MGNLVSPITTDSSPIRLKPTLDPKSTLGNYYRIVYESEGIEIDPMIPKGSLTNKFNSENVLIDESTVKSWLSINHIDQLNNQYIVRGNQSVLFNQDPNKYSIRLGDHIYYFESSDNDLIDELNESLSSLITSLGDGSLNIPIIESSNYKNLIKKDNLSDYVSFEHQVEVVGSVADPSKPSPLCYEIKVGSDITQHFMYYRSEQMWYGIYEMVPKYGRIVNPGDIVEISIGYRIEDPSIDDSEVLQRMMYDDQYMIHNGHKMYYGRTLAHTVSTMIVVDDMIDSDTGESSSYKINLLEDLILEVSSDCIVVYSMSPNIKEFIVKSCKLIKAES